jgi:hypothetical protein
MESELAHQVKDMTEAVQNLPSLISAIETFITTPEITKLIIMVVLPWLLVNRGGFSRAFDMIERRERRRLEQINEYISSHDSADPEMIKAVRDLRDAHYFNIATGIYAENRTRSAFIKIHQSSSHCIAWKHIQRARPYIEIAADETVTIRDLTLFEHLSYWYNQCVAYASLFLALALFFFRFGLSPNKNISLFLSTFGVSFLLAAFALFVFIQNMPVHARERIATELERLRNCNSEA